MNINHIIPIISYSLIIILILMNYIVIKKPYKYLLILFIIPAIIFQTPIVNNLNKVLESVFVTLYFVSAMIFLIYCVLTEKK
ncbi:hypothetical protein [Clostridium sp.]